MTPEELVKLPDVRDKVLSSKGGSDGGWGGGGWGGGGWGGWSAASSPAQAWAWSGANPNVWAGQVAANDAAWGGPGAGSIAALAQSYAGNSGNINAADITFAERQLGMAPGGDAGSTAAPVSNVPGADAYALNSAALGRALTGLGPGSTDYPTASSAAQAWAWSGVRDVPTWAAAAAANDLAMGYAPGQGSYAWRDLYASPSTGQSILNWLNQPMNPNAQRTTPDQPVPTFPYGPGTVPQVQPYPGTPGPQSSLPGYDAYGMDTTNTMVNPYTGTAPTIGGYYDALQERLGLQSGTGPGAPLGTDAGVTEQGAQAMQNQGFSVGQTSTTYGGRGPGPGPANQGGGGQLGGPGAGGSASGGNAVSNAAGWGGGGWTARGGSGANPSLSTLASGGPGLSGVVGWGGLTPTQARILYGK